MTGCSDKVVISGRLKYRGAHAGDEDEDKMMCVRSERDWGAFTREIRVPRGLDEHDVKAEMEHG